MASPMAHPEHDHDHEHEHEGHEHGEEDTRIRVLHGASPFCHWSFGYEPVLQRLRLVYGDQIKVNTYNIPVYERWQQWMEDYGLDEASLRAWIDEMEGLIGLPLNREYLKHPTASCDPGTRVLHAAEAAKPGAGEQVARRLLFALYVEGRNFDDQEALLALAEQAGAPRKAVEAALADGRADEAMKADGQDMHALGLNFFELQIADGKRRVMLEHGFDPAQAESALEWLSGGTLRKRALPSVADYVAQHAPLTRFEVERVFRLSAADAERAAAPAEKAGKVQRKTLNGHPCWLPK